MEFRWDAAKNALLKQTRGVSFEMVVEAIEAGHLLDDAPHPRRPSQRILVLKLLGYVCSIPYVHEGETMFLKTIYQDRRMNTFYGGRDGTTFPKSKG